MNYPYKIRLSKKNDNEYKHCHPLNLGNLFSSSEDRRSNLYSDDAKKLTIIYSKILHPQKIPRCQSDSVKPTISSLSLIST